MIFCHSSWLHVLWFGFKSLNELDLLCLSLHWVLLVGSIQSFFFSYLFIEKVLCSSFIYIIQVREREESQIIKERDERWVNSVRVCLDLGIEMVSFEMFWTWLALTQALGVVSEIYPNNFFFFFSLKKNLLSLLVYTLLFCWISWVMWGYNSIKKCL